MANPADPNQNSILTLDPRFQWSYRVLSSLYLANTTQQSELESGGKVILPQEALEQLSNHPGVLLRPIQFRVTNPSQTAAPKITHCGVLEFTAPVNTVCMPVWMMNYLGVADHSILNIDRALLPKATYCKLQPQSSNFLDITNPQAMLENAFRRFGCLTRGDILTVQYNMQEYKLRVQEIQPAPAVSIIDCDMKTDFAEPVDYQPPPPAKKPVTDKQLDKLKVTPKKGSSCTFKGPGYRLNRKTPIKARPVAGARREDADAIWKIGTIKFTRELTTLTYFDCKLQNIN